MLEILYRWYAIGALCTQIQAHNELHRRRDACKKRALEGFL